MTRPPRRSPSRSSRFAFAAALLLCLWGWLGISASEEAALRTFNLSAAQWQAAPEFRSVAMEYCDDGSRALLTRPFFISPGGTVMAVRSLPGIPKRFAVNPTSALHYRRFSRGPLSAYLHLCTEQDLSIFWKVLTDLTANQPDAPLRGKQFLEAFHMDEPVCMDAGAVQSALAAARDIDPSRPLVSTGPLGPLLVPHIRAIAAALDAPPDIDAMSPAQQRAVLSRLDAVVRQSDPELWRTKQLNDLCAGIWAQVYGPSYGYVITPALLLHRAAGVGLLLLMAWLVYRQGRERPTSGAFDPASGNTPRDTHETLD